MVWSVFADGEGGQHSALLSNPFQSARFSLPFYNHPGTEGVTKSNMEQ